MRRPPRSTRVRSSAASDVYKRQVHGRRDDGQRHVVACNDLAHAGEGELSLIHISEPTRLLSISYVVFCLKKKKSLGGDAEYVLVIETQHSRLYRGQP